MLDAPVDKRDDQRFKPTILRGDFSNPPPALAPLRARPQWVIWRLIWRAGRWTKPPFRCDDPHRFASSADPGSWCSYEAAVAAAAAGDGITYVLRPEDPFAAVDIDDVRDPVTGTVETWAQRLLDQASHTYLEVSPSGCVCVSGALPTVRRYTANSSSIRGRWNCSGARASRSP